MYLTCCRNLKRGGPGGGGARGVAVCLRGADAADNKGTDGPRGSASSLRPRPPGGGAKRSGAGLALAPPPQGWCGSGSWRRRRAVPPLEGGDTCARRGPGWCVRPCRAGPGGRGGNRGRKCSGRQRGAGGFGALELRAALLPCVRSLRSAGTGRGSTWRVAEGLKVAGGGGRAARGGRRTGPGETGPGGPDRAAPRGAPPLTPARSPAPRCRSWRSCGRR